jgi:FkbM family methyltransferase
MSNLSLALASQYLRHSPIEIAKWRISDFLRKKLAANPVHSIIRVAGGVLMELDTSDFLQRELYVFRDFEPAITHEIKKRLKPGDTFVDIGANVGFYSLIAAQAACKVYAFEPAPKTRSILERNLRLNGAKDVTAIEVALSDAAGEGELFLDAKNNSGAASLRRSPNSGNSVSITLDTYDHFSAVNALPNPALIKIDVEGAELEVLRGAAGLFQQSAPSHIFVECIDHHLNRFNASSRMLIQWLVEAGFRVSALKAGRWVEVNPENGISMDLYARRA